MKKIQSILLAIALWLPLAGFAQAPQQLSDHHALKRLSTEKQYVLLPVEESAENAHIRVLRGGEMLKEFNCRLAINKVDYYVPLDMQQLGEDDVVLDIVFPENRRSSGSLMGFACWTKMKESDVFDVSNRESLRPVYHHTPAYGWMNDPNGMFYKDGVWHLYYQHNPFGSQWENMTWGHSTSTDLVHWKNEGEAIEPDALGTIFSGSAVVDENNTAGFGKGAIVAMYTSARENQTQSLAYSLDGGITFEKYAFNPVITTNAPDFRDPHLFWYEPTKRWIVILSCGQHMNIYSSENLKDWTFESSFGEEYGCHGGVWECPDLMEIPVADTGESKWLLLCNINPGGPSGGSATQYFTGQFDGHKFTCDSDPKVTKWMDYGKDHYATVTFFGAPDGRHVALPWMSNWQYANQVPTTQYRSANGLPRDLGLFSYKGDTYVSTKPSPEVMAAFSKKPSANISKACRVDITLRSHTTITLSNNKGEEVVMTYDADKEEFTMDRTKSGKTDFSADFPAITKSPTYGKIRTLQLFIDNSCLEAFDVDGKMVMSNIVFPSEHYSSIAVKGGKCKIYRLK